MALFFRKMALFNTQKIKNYLILSLIFHILLFIVCSSFSLSNKYKKNLEVFILNGNPIAEKTKSGDKILKKQHIKRVEKKEINQDIKQTAENNVAIITEQLSNTTESNIVSSIEQKIVVSQSSLTDGKEGKFIDSEFGTVHGPKFIHKEMPVYPQIARKLGKEGEVILRLTLNEKGEVVNIEIIQSALYGFTESAIEAVKKSKFSPAIKDGKPIACRAILPIRFVLKN